MFSSSSIRNFIGRNIRRRMFDNRKFWDERYSEDPEKGSGPGSRGEFLALKNKLIRQVLGNGQYTTVLDIGCGDIAILDGLEITEYVGVDISSVVVEKNRKLRPEWQFLCEDLTGQFVPQAADLVLCLDVLIHQRNRSAYSMILSKALTATRKLALVSGYPRPYRGANVFFHEPIEVSVGRLCPDAKIARVAEYQHAHLLSVER